MAGYKEGKTFFKVGKSITLNKDLSISSLKLPSPIEDFLMVLASESPMALGGLTTGHVPTTETHSLSVTDEDWRLSGPLYNEADAPEPTLEGGSCMVMINETVFEIGTEAVATYVISVEVIFLNIETWV